MRGAFGLLCIVTLVGIMLLLLLAKLLRIREFDQQIARLRHWGAPVPPRETPVPR